MRDLISRQAAIEELNKLDVSDGVGISSIACGVQESAVIAIQHLPSAQPERKRGMWIIDEKRFGNAEHHCNLCGAILEGDEWKWRNNYFCYHCGADMRGEEDERRD